MKKQLMGAAVASIVTIGAIGTIGAIQIQNEIIPINVLSMNSRAATQIEAKNDSKDNQNYTTALIGLLAETTYNVTLDEMASTSTTPIVVTTGAGITEADIAFVLDTPIEEAQKVTITATDAAATAPTVVFKVALPYTPAPAVAAPLSVTKTSYNNSDKVLTVTFNSDIKKDNTYSQPALTIATNDVDANWIGVGTDNKSFLFEITGLSSEKTFEIEELTITSNNPTANLDVAVTYEDDVKTVKTGYVAPATSFTATAINATTIDLTGGTFVPDNTYSLELTADGQTLITTSGIDTDSKTAMTITTDALLVSGVKYDVVLTSSDKEETFVATTVTYTAPKATSFDIAATNATTIDLTDGKFVTTNTYDLTLTAAGQTEITVKNITPTDESTMTFTTTALVSGVQYNVELTSSDINETFDPTTVTYTAPATTFVATSKDATIIDLTNGTFVASSTYDLALTAAGQTEITVKNITPTDESTMTFKTSANGLVSGVQYTVELTSSDKGETFNSTTVTYTAPAATSFTATATNATTIDLTDGKFVTTNTYDLKLTAKDEIDITTSNIKPTSETAMTITTDALKSGVQYTVKLTSSDINETFNQTDVTYTAPNAPATSFTATATSATTIDLTGGTFVPANTYTLKLTADGQTPITTSSIDTASESAMTITTDALKSGVQYTVELTSSDVNETFDSTTVTYTTPAVAEIISNTISLTHTYNLDKIELKQEANISGTITLSEAVVLDGDNAISLNFYAKDTSVPIEKAVNLKSNMDDNVITLTGTSFGEITDIEKAQKFINATLAEGTFNETYYATIDIKTVDDGTLTLTLDNDGTTDNGGSDGWSGGAIAGIVIGSLAVVGLIAGGGYYFYTTKKPA